MPTADDYAEPFQIGDAAVSPGEAVDVDLKVSETYAGVPLHIPLRVARGKKSGPAIFVMGAIHGDEINGVGVVRSLILDQDFELAAGTLILAPVVNILGFELQTRYLPDRRDLNRMFPGSPTGSLASRYAHTIFTEIIRRCDAGIDLHSAATRRTNFPNVRADLTRPKVREIARAFGAELIVSGKGPRGALRRAACTAGVPTIILEAGEVFKIESGVVDVGVRGVRNVLMHFGMLEGEPEIPRWQVEITKTNWVRAPAGGLLQFHVAPGDIVAEDQPVATLASLLGRTLHMISAPVSGVVLGTTTLPAVKPGDPVVHLAIPEDPKSLSRIRRARRGADDEELDERLRADLATNIHVTEPAENETDPEA